jgi:predicted aspartyl protease
VGTLAETLRARIWSSIFTPKMAATALDAAINFKRKPDETPLELKDRVNRLRHVAGGLAVGPDGKKVLLPDDAVVISKLRDAFIGVQNNTVFAAGRNKPTLDATVAAMQEVYLDNDRHGAYAKSPPGGATGHAAAHAVLAAAAIPTTATAATPTGGTWRCEPHKTNGHPWSHKDLTDKDRANGIEACRNNPANPNYRPSLHDKFDALANALQGLVKKMNGDKSYPVSRASASPQAKEDGAGTGAHSQESAARSARKVPRSPSPPSPPSTAANRAEARRTRNTRTAEVTAGAAKGAPDSRAKKSGAVTGAHSKESAARSARKVPHSKPSPTPPAAAASRTTPAGMAAVTTPTERIRLTVRVTIGGKERVGLVDTGSNWTVISRSALSGLCYSDRQANVKQAQVVGGGIVAISGVVAIGIEIGTHKIQADVAVIDGDNVNSLIIGTDVLDRLGVMDGVREKLTALGARVEATALGAEIGRVNVDPRPASEISIDPKLVEELDLSHIKLPRQREELRQLLRECADIFTLGNVYPPPLKDYPEINLYAREGVEVDAVMRQRDWSLPVQGEMKNHIEKLVKYQIAEKVVDQADANIRSEPLLVGDLDDNTRFVIDMSMVNPYFRDDPYPIKTVTQFVSALTGDCGSEWDMTGAFYLGKIAKPCRRFLQFRGHDGLYQLTRLPMGAKPAPAIFNRMVQEGIIAKLPAEVRDGVHHYFDDMAHTSRASADEVVISKALQALVAAGHKDATRQDALDSTAIDEEIKALRLIFPAFKELGVYLRWDKLKLCVTEAKVVGYDWCRGKIKPAGKHVERIVAFGDLEKKGDVRRFLGLCNIFQRHIPKFWTIAAPLRELTGGARGPIKMTPAAIDAKEKLTRAIQDVMALRLPRADGGPFTMRVDASEVGLGAALFQDGEPVSFWGRALRGGEPHYSAPDKEQLAIVEALEAFEIYVGGAHVHVRVLTDHQPHKGLESSTPHRVRSMTPLRARWKERELRFRFTVDWAPREEQSVPDAIANSPAFRKEVEKNKGEGPQFNAATVVEATTETHAVWRERQLRDPETGALLELKENDTFPPNADATKRKRLQEQAERTVVVQGVLFHLDKAEHEEGPHLQLWIPAVDGLREKEIRIHHGFAREGKATREGHGQVKDGEGAHEGGMAMYMRLKQTKFWPTMQQDCALEAKRCHICKMFRRIRNNYGKLQPTRSENLMGQYGVDWATMTQTEEGFRHLLIWVSYYSGWVVAVPTKDMKIETFIKAMEEEFVPERGIPLRLRSDRQFITEASQAYFEEKGIKHKAGAAYNPQQDGMAENMVKQTKTELKKELVELGGDFVRHLPRVLTKLRSKHSVPRGASPFEIEFGYPMPLPSNFDSPAFTIVEPSVAKRNNIINMVLRKREAAAYDYETRYNKKRVEAPFKKGDWVWWGEHGEGPTERPKRSGPYEIKEMHGALDAELAELPQGPTIGNRHNVVNVKHLEIYEQEPILQPEEVVREIIKHRKRKKHIRYLTRWADGDETWQRAASFIDKNGAEIVINDVLKAYWEEHPELREEEGYPEL